MCWSKVDSEPSQHPTTTAPRRPMDKVLECSGKSTPCKDPKEKLCINGGICCRFPDVDKPVCRCPYTHGGDYCHIQIFDESRLMMERTKVVAAFSAVLGVFVIVLFVVLIVLQVKYYRHRKKRIMTDGHEMNVIPKSPDSGSKINQPGYSWRESVRRSSRAFQKLQGPSSKSVPDDLFNIGITIALFNLKACEQKKDGGGGGGGGGADAVGRCFSADAGGRGEGGSAVDFGPKTTRSPTRTDNGQEGVPLSRTEDAEGK